MKTYRIFSILLCVCLASCEKSQDPLPTGNTGFLKLDLGVTLEIREVSARKLAVDTETFQLFVYNELQQEVLFFERIADAPDEIELEEGEYYVVAHSNNLKPAAFENPYYYGRSGNFQIIRGESTEVPLECELANCMVSVTYSDNVVDNFSSYAATVSVLNESLLFSADETRPGYFDVLPISISATLERQAAGGETETTVIEGNIPAPAARTHYEVTIDATANNGSVSFNITVNENVEVQALTFSDDSNSPAPVDEVEYGDLIITEAMFNPDAVNDANGEWVEIFNAGPVAVNLNGLKLADNSSALTVNEDLVLHAGAHAVIAKTEEAVEEPDFVSSSLGLTNAGETLTLLKPDDTEIASVDFVQVFEGIVEEAGASVSLDASGYEVESAKEAGNWCNADASYSTGDLGTPGDFNGSCE